MNITRVGVDIAKNSFHLCAMTSHGKVVWRKALRRGQWLSTLQQQAAEGIEIGMEACGSAHYWARELQRRGYTCKLIAPQHVKPYRKSHKTDHTDAEAIGEAMSRPEMRFVPIKTCAQQDIQSTHRIRESLIKQRTAISNQIRGLAAEYGLIAPLGDNSLRRAMTLWLDEDNELSPYLCELLFEMRTDLDRANERVKQMDRHINELATRDPLARRLQQLQGVGPVCATILSAALGNGSAFRNGRDFAVSLGLTPKQHSTGGRERLLGISKRGDGYIRKQLVHGARSALLASAGRDDALSRWLDRLRVRKHANVVTVALAAKTARIAWALAHDGVDYDPERAAASVVG